MKQSIPTDWADLTQAQQAERILWYREQCRKDPLFLGREVLGYNYIEYDLPYHQDMRRQIMHIGDQMTLCPRYFIKSTLITTVGSIWLLIHDPKGEKLGFSSYELAIGITSNSTTSAKTFLKEITDHFTKENSFFRQIFPEICPEEHGELPTQEQYTLPCRQLPRKEPTLEAFGIKTGRAGRHYDIIIADDIVHERNTAPFASEDEMMKVVSQARALWPLLRRGEPHSHVRFVGTRWHDADAYGVLLSDEEFRATLQVLIRKPAEDGVPLWPSRFPLAKLADEKIRLGSYLWACLMEQDPLPPDSAIRFDEAWFHNFDLSIWQKQRDRFRIAITVDPAFAEHKAGADRTAIAVTAVPSEGGLYLLSLRAGHYRPSETIQHIIDLWDIWRPEWLGIECDGGGRAVYNTMRDRIIEDGLGISLREIYTEGQPKDARVSRLSYYAERHGIWVHSRIREEYINEIRRFPVGRWRDVPDVLAARVIKYHRAEPIKTRKAPKAWRYEHKDPTGEDILQLFEAL